MRMARILAALCGGVMFLLSGCGAAPAATVGANASESAGADAQAVAETSSGADLEIVCFQAGKADAFLLLTSDSAVLIDCGEKGFGRTILAELERRGVEKLDCMIITHFDQDHVGGAARIINNFPVSRILQNNSPKDSEEYEKYMKAVTNAGIEPETVRENLSFVIGGASYTVNPPKRADYSDSDSNNSSLIISVENGANRFLFTGDAEDERTEEYLALDWGQYDFLKVPHHGRWQETLPLLVETTAPRYAVITSSDDEPEDAETLELLKTSGAETFLTRTGQVIVRSDGASLSVEYA